MAYDDEYKRFDWSRKRRRVKQMRTALRKPKTTVETKKRRADDAADGNVVAMFTDKSPTLAEGRVALRQAQTMWLKTCTDPASVITMTDGAFTALSTIQMNSVFEPVDTEAEQPRGHDTLATLYKRCRVSKCAIEAWVSVFPTAPVSGPAGTFRPMFIGLTAHVAGEAPASLREALENPRTVYKSLVPENHRMAGTNENYIEHYRGNEICIRGIFDCAEVFGSKKEYYSLDDTVNASANPTTMMICTLWAAMGLADSAEDWSFIPVIITNQKCRWFMPEKLTTS